ERRLTKSSNIGPDLLPRGVATWLQTTNNAFGAKFAQSTRDRGSADSRQRALEIGIAELLRQALDRIADHVALRASPGAGHADAVLEVAVRLHEHHADEVLPPRHERVSPFVPALR